MRREKHAFSIPSDCSLCQHEKVDTEKIIQLNIFSKVDIGERFASSLLLTPSEGVGHTRVFLTPSEGVE